jgi:sporulation protein YlmC with PRC-barrel domain
MKSFDADNLTGKNHEGPDRNKPLQFLTATSIIGDDVINPEEEQLGKIHNIMIDLATGKIEYVVVESGRFLGVGEKFFAMPYELMHVAPKGHSFVLNKSREMFKKAPGFDKSHWPETNARYAESTAYWSRPI